MERFFVVVFLVIIDNRRIKKKTYRCEKILLLKMLQTFLVHRCFGCFHKGKYVNKYCVKKSEKR